MFTLVDGHEFYVSCERLFRPSLLGHPVGLQWNYTLRPRHMRARVTAYQQESLLDKYWKSLTRPLQCVNADGAASQAEQ